MELVDFYWEMEVYLSLFSYNLEYWKNKKLLAISADIKAVKLTLIQEHPSIIVYIVFIFDR
jgi:hypothetical protein